MNFNGKGLSRSVMGTMLIAGVGANVVVPMTAMAADPENGSVTITASTDNAGVTYNVWRIFTADVTNGKLTHIEWESTAMKNAVEAVIKADTPAYAGTSAQEAAEFIAGKLGTDITGATTVGGGPVLADDAFGNALADAVDALAVTDTLTPGTAKTLREGYYLVATKSDTIGTGKMGTSPIFLTVDKDNAVTMTEKTTVPTIAKQVKEDATGTFGPSADGNIAQDLSFKLTGTLPANLDGFETYSYKFNDTLPTGMSLKGGNTSSVKVYADGTDITSKDGVEIAYSNDVLTVTFADILAVDVDGQGAKVNKDSVITVEYDAHLDTDCVIGTGGNQNSVYIEYSNNPNTTGKGNTQTKTAKVFAYQIELTKIDKVTAEQLNGAKFTIQVDSTNADAASRGKYVQADGSLGDSPYEFTTVNGKFSVSGLDEGVYKIHETTPPANYDAIASDITLTITATKDATSGEVTALTATFSGGMGDGVDANTDGIVESGSGITQITSSTGKIDLQVTNDKQITIPGTGLTGNEAMLYGAGAIAVISVAGFLMRTKRVSE